LLLGLVLGLVAAFGWPTPVGWQLRGVIGWDIGAIVVLGIVLPRITTADAECTRIRAGAEDPGRTMVFAIAVLSSLFSLFAGVTVLRRARGFSSSESLLWSGLALLAVALSWVLTHTAYTLRYAHLFYRAGRKDEKAAARVLPGADARPLVFPGTEAPEELDFAYFAFTIGMCFQVSDVVIGTSAMRRTALLHALLSFVYNTTILALALNLLFGFFS
jgi:uncharacterized membrane protein